MPTDNVEIALETFRRFDPDDLGPWAELLDPGVRLTVAEGWPEQGPFMGKEAVVRQFDRLFEDFSEPRFQDVTVVTASGDWVVLSWVLVATGRASGLPVELNLAAAFRFEDGLSTEGHFRWTAEQALDAAGLTG